LVPCNTGESEDLQEGGKTPPNKNGGKGNFITSPRSAESGTSKGEKGGRGGVSLVNEKEGGGKKLQCFLSSSAKTNNKGKGKKKGGTVFLTPILKEKGEKSDVFAYAGHKEKGEGIQGREEEGKGGGRQVTFENWGEGRGKKQLLMSQECQKRKKGKEGDGFLTIPVKKGKAPCP